MQYREVEIDQRWSQGRWKLTFLVSKQFSRQRYEGERLPILIAPEAVRRACELDHFEQSRRTSARPAGYISRDWPKKDLVATIEPVRFGASALECFGQYLGRICAWSPEIHRRFVSMPAAGNCEFDLEIVKRLVQEGKMNFSIDCIAYQADHAGERQVRRGSLLLHHRQHVLRHVSEHQLVDASIESTVCRA